MRELRVADHPAPWTLPCLCILDVDRTLTARQSASSCAGTQARPAVTDSAYGGGPLQLSSLALKLGKSFCASCYLGVITAGSVGWDGAAERSALLDLLKGSSKKGLGGATVADWSLASRAEPTPLVISATDGAKQDSVPRILAWYQERTGASIRDENVFIFDDKAYNVEGYAHASYNALQVSCGSRDGEVGLCGGLPEELVQMTGVRLCDGRCLTQSCGPLSWPPPPTTPTPPSASLSPAPHLPPPRPPPSPASSQPSPPSASATRSEQGPTEAPLAPLPPPAPLPLPPPSQVKENQHQNQQVVFEHDVPAAAPPRFRPAVLGSGGALGWPIVAVASALIYCSLRYASPRWPKKKESKAAASRKKSRLSRDKEELRQLATAIGEREEDEQADHAQHSSPGSCWLVSLPRIVALCVAAIVLMGCVWLLRPHAKSGVGAPPEVAKGSPAAQEPISPRQTRAQIRAPSPPSSAEPFVGEHDGSDGTIAALAPTVKVGTTLWQRDPPVPPQAVLPPPLSSPPPPHPPPSPPLPRPPSPPPWSEPDARWCSEDLPPRPALPPNLNSYDDGWIPLIEDRSCNKKQLKHYGVVCSNDGVLRVYRFSAGIYDLSQQVWLPARVVIEGAASPNVVGAPRQRSDLTKQTLFMARTRGCPRHLTESKMDWPIPMVHGRQPVKCLRKGFLMSDETSIVNINGQGLDEDGGGFVQDGQPDSYAGLNGGAFFELPGCVTSFAVDGTCGRKDHASYHGEGGDHGRHFVTGAGRGVHDVLIDNVRLNDLTDTASLSAFWSAMTPDGSAHQNITFRKVVTMRTVRDGINVHGNVVNWRGEDLHFENQGDDVFAVWGAGGGRHVDQTGFAEPFVKCGLTNRPASDIVFRRTFAKPGGEWSSCAHIFGAGTVVYDRMLCCARQPTNPYPALSIASTFCPDYSHANVTFKDLHWYNHKAEDLCRLGGPTPVYAAAADAPATGWKQSHLRIQELGCKTS